MQVGELRDYLKTLPISQIVGKYISIKKRGANFEGLCPFHNDHDPSLKLNDSKGLFKCFVCGEAGDAISFVEKYQNLNFLDAMENLAETLGIQLEKSPKKHHNPKLDFAFRILDATEKLYFNFALKTRPAPYVDFVKKRKLTKETVEKFHIGYAPDGNLLVQFLETKQKENPDKKIIEMAIELGLIKQGRNGLYDTFRERIIFPIWDHVGQVRGFGSRQIRDDQHPKYLNSKDSFVFNKGNLLYGFHLARKKIGTNSPIILTEGYMDAIALHQKGFETAIAVMGIALTPEKAKHLARISEAIYLSFDSDKAGLDAAMRAHNALISFGVLAKKLDLSPHKDPDDFINAMGDLAFQERIDHAKTFLDQLIDREVTQNFGDNTDLKLKSLERVFELVAPLGEQITATERVILAARSLGLRSSPESLVENYKNSLSKTPILTQRVTSQEPQETAQTQKNPQSAEKRTVKAVPKLNKIDKWILKGALSFPQFINDSEFTEILDFVTNNDVKQFVLEWSRAHYADGGSPNLSDLLHQNGFGDELKNYLFSQWYGIIVNNDKKEAKRFLSDLRKKVSRENLIAEKNHLMKKRSDTLNQTELSEIDQRIMQLSKEISNLKSNKNPAEATQF